MRGGEEPVGGCSTGIGVCTGAGSDAVGDSGAAGTGRWGPDEVGRMDMAASSDVYGSKVGADFIVGLEGIAGRTDSAGRSRRFGELA
jgi:hypothetical protein